LCHLSCFHVAFIFRFPHILPNKDHSNVQKVIETTGYNMRTIYKVNICFNSPLCIWFANPSLYVISSTGFFRSSIQVTWKFISHFSLLLFAVNNRALFQINSEINNINTRHGFNFHRPNVHLTTYKIGAYYTGIKVFNCLPTHIQIYLIMLINLNWLWGIFFIIIYFIL
jgi:hypothetical protein